MQFSLCVRYRCIVAALGVGDAVCTQGLPHIALIRVSGSRVHTLRAIQGIQMCKLKQESLYLSRRKLGSKELK